MSTDHDDMTEESNTTNNEARAQAADNGSYERAPKDFEADVDATKVKVPDHPVFVYPKIKGEIKKCSAYLVTQGDLEDRMAKSRNTRDDRASRKRQAEEGEADVQELGAKAIVDLLNEMYVSPSFDITVEDYRSAPAGYYEEYANQLLPEMGGN